MTQNKELYREKEKKKQQHRTCLQVKSREDFPVFPMNYSIVLCMYVCVGVARENIRIMIGADALFFFPLHPSFYQQQQQQHCIQSLSVYAFWIWKSFSDALNSV